MTPDRAAVALIAAWPFLFFWRAALGLGMFYFGDIARFFYPTRLLYANALAAGRLPLWTPELLMGFPLYAEMQTGALYPPHLVLYRLLPTDLAINYDILLHLAWLGVGFYLFVRARKIGVVGSMVAAMAFAAGGFGAGRITHMSVLAVAAWLPWSLLLYEKWRTSPRLYYWVMIVLLFALQFVAGHPQFIFLSVLTFIAYAAGAALGLLDDPSQKSSGGDSRIELSPQDQGQLSLRTRRILRAAVPKRHFIMSFLPVMGLAISAGIAAIQLVPTAVLAEASARAGGVTEAFFTEFSYKPQYLALLFDPFVLGNPYPNVSVEVIAYLGAMPLLLAGFALLRRRDRTSLFWLGVAAVSFLLSLGGLNPIYRELRFLPLLNLFRVPARFLFPMSLALAMLAGKGMDTLLEQAPIESLARTAKVIAIGATCLVVSIVALVEFIDADGWVLLWRLLAPAFFCLSFFFILRARSGKIGRISLSGLVLGIVFVDLAAFGAVYARTFNVIAPRSEVFAAPRVLASLNLEDGARTLTSEWKLPWVSQMSESLYPNLNAAFGVAGAQGYTPLAPSRTMDFLDHLSPAMLNLLGVRYYLIPQDLPVDPKSEAQDLFDPFIPDYTQQSIEFPPTEATGLEIDSALAQSANLANGFVVANIKLTSKDGQIYTVPLRAGYDTAEWAYERSDVRRAVKHTEPQIASTFPARSAFPVESHPGHTYRADLSFSATAAEIVRIEIDPVIPAGLIYVQKIVLTNGNSHVNIATLVGRASHSLVYRSEDVAVFENPDYAPRAFLTHTGVVVSDREALSLLQAPDYSGELYIANGEALESDAGQGLDEGVDITSYEPDRVVLNVRASSEGYVVLTDAWDPGWIATVDGQSTPIRRADLVFRAVLVGPGSHRVEFQYRPLSFYVGMILSGISLAVLGVIVCLVWLLCGRTRSPVI